jgi:hypothetical protein
MIKEAMKLALARLQARTDTADLDAIAALNEALAKQPAPVQDWRLVPIQATRAIEDAIAKARNLKASEIWEDALAAAPHTAQQEPYCYVYTEHGEEYFAPPTGYVPDDATPRYTSPPAQRKPLTDEQIDVLRQKTPPSSGVDFDVRCRDFARAIEAAHGIKENT